MLRAQGGHVADVLLVPFLVFSERLNRVLFGIVVDQFVASRTEHHEILRAVNVGSASLLVSPRTLELKRHDVGNLRKISCRERDVMFEKVLVAAIKFAPAASRYEEEQAHHRRNGSNLPHRGSCRKWLSLAKIPSGDKTDLMNELRFRLCSDCRLEKG
jgi:hypothetical protein